MDKDLLHSFVEPLKSQLFGIEVVTGVELEPDGQVGGDGWHVIISTEDKASLLENSVFQDMEQTFLDEGVPYQIAEATFHPLAATSDLT